MLHSNKPSLEEAYEELCHYGMPRRSGRYPWGSGKDPYQHSGDFISRVEELKKQNFVFTDKDGKTYTGEKAIAKSMGMSTTDFRAHYGVAHDLQRSLKTARAKSLRADGLSLNQIAKEMGYPNDSSVRTLLNEKREVRMKQAMDVAESLKKIVDEKGMIDVGDGVEVSLNLSKEKMRQALIILEMAGYNTFGSRVPQPTNPKQMTTLKVLCPPGTPYKINSKGQKVSSAAYNFEDIHSVDDYIARDGEVGLVKKFQYPKSMDPSRLMVRYKEDGGIDKDGIIEIRRNIQDLDLKGSHYAQVRILVDNDRYLKGMAVYSDDKNFPPGVDVIFNTNKSKDTPMRKVLKEIKSDPDNPFGSNLREEGGQYEYVDKNGKKQLGLINKTRMEGDWADWSDKLPAQFLSKQSLPLAKRQLGLAIKDKQDEFNEILSLTNPTIKKKLLQDFSDSCDSAAVHLHAAALPRQKHQVIIPITSMKDNEVYAPRYENGEKVALIRYPHGGTFEIPILTVNNKHKIANEILGPDVKDAVGINSKVAEQLSGADFDGDTVMVIPTNDKVKITGTKPLKELEGFDPKMEYGTEEKRTGQYDKKGKEIVEYYNRYGRKITPMSDKTKQIQMGVASNLITDMTLKGATTKELARAVRHSMVVIDAQKHHLDWRQSEMDHGIDSLRKTYQSGGGADTLLSKAKSPTRVPKRKGSPRINTKFNKKGEPNPYYDPNVPEGAYVYKKDEDRFFEKTIVNKRTGEKTTVIKERTDPSYQMSETHDARTLISKFNTPMERVYADYANAMKGMANRARMEMLSAGRMKHDRQAAVVYQEQVDSLKKKLYRSEMNKPRERQATTIATSRINAKIQSNPDMTKKEQKKMRQQEISRARELVGAKRIPIEINDKEWEAIQAGAISEDILNRITKYADMDSLRERATPRTTTTLTTVKVNRAKAMKDSGLTLAQIAKALGVSTSTVSKYLD